MSKDVVEKKHYHTFESLKQNEDRCEFWSARQLAKVLEYYEYRNFLPVIERAKVACQKSGQHVENHFVVVNEMVEEEASQRKDQGKKQCQQNPL